MVTANGGFPRERLIRHSLDLLSESQAPGGAFPAAPDYPTYRYSWIRDGTFIAHALDLYGHHTQAAAFHRWTAATVLRHRDKVDHLASLPATTAPPEEAVLHTRYTLDGEEVSARWGNFQLDGYGFWLSGLHHHLERTGGDPNPYREAVTVAARYLTLAWPRPSYDCWEEYPTRRHPATLAAIAAGLQHAARLLDEAAHAATATAILEEIAGNGMRDGALVKLLDEPLADPVGTPSPSVPRAVAGHEQPGKPIDADAVDGSALLVIGELGPYPADSETATATLHRIETDLVVGGGVHRYRDDEYYGGGQWILLSAALAGIHARRGDRDRAETLLGWIERHPDPQGNLPEQVATVLRNPAHHQPWVDRWGPMGSPLLWSHAMYLIAVGALEGRMAGEAGSP